ncbi:MAG TPA: acetyltransferase [Desulfobacteraceae bacterium]|nr:acetyltransferase [Desulfobacteraceae bacterium]
MQRIDVFNGDADGICALHQLRLNNPLPDALLVTGVKRDIGLLARLEDVRNSDITVLDISLDHNRAALTSLLERGNKILYIDHHFSGPTPLSPHFEAHIDPQPQTCTSIIVDTLLHGQWRSWAIIGAFGDNLDESALRLADSLSLDPEKTAMLKEMGILLNYNGYGAGLDDLFYHPADLYRQVSAYADPLTMYERSPALRILKQGYEEDMERAMREAPVRDSPGGRIFRLPAEPWARRVAGVFSNTLARQQPEKAHALIVLNSDGTLRISVRAPLSNRTGADTLCRRFPSGGGRAAAAGINNLPADQADAFMQAFTEHF